MPPSSASTLNDVPRPHCCEDTCARWRGASCLSVCCARACGLATAGSRASQRKMRMGRAAVVEALRMVATAATGGRVSKVTDAAPLRRCRSADITDADTPSCNRMAQTQKTPPERGFLRSTVSRGAQERTRTSTKLPPLAPEASASTNSATWATQEANCASCARRCQRIRHNFSWWPVPAGDGRRRRGGHAHCMSATTPDYGSCAACKLTSALCTGSLAERASCTR